MVTFLLVTNDKMFWNICSSHNYMHGFIFSFRFCFDIYLPIHMTIITYLADPYGPEQFGSSLSFSFHILFVIFLSRQILAISLFEGWFLLIGQLDSNANIWVIVSSMTVSMRRENIRIWARMVLRFHLPNTILSLFFFRFQPWNKKIGLLPSPCFTPHSISFVSFILLSSFVTNVLFDNPFETFCRIELRKIITWILIQKMFVFLIFSLDILSPKKLWWNYGQKLLNLSN